MKYNEISCECGRLNAGLPHAAPNYIKKYQPVIFEDLSEPQRMSVNSNDGWGHQSINQTTPWSVEDSPRTRRRELERTESNVWSNEPNNGTTVWENARAVAASAPGGGGGGGGGGQMGGPHVGADPPMMWGPQGPNHGSQGPNHGSQGPNHGSQGPNHGSQGPNHGSQGPNHGSQGPNHGSQAHLAPKQETPMQLPPHAPNTGVFGNAPNANMNGFCLFSPPFHFWSFFVYFS